MVEGAASMGMKAVFLAYVLPLVLLILVMVLCLTLIAPGNEVLAALVSLGILLPYAFLLYLLKDKLSKKFRFEIRSLMNDID